MLGQSDRSIAAAHKAGARPEVWAAVHEIHGARGMAVIETEMAWQSAYITGIDPKGFTITHGVHIGWPEALNVLPVDDA